MIAEIFKEPYPYIVIDDFYDFDEYNMIWQELDFLTYERKMMKPEDSGSATFNGRYLKNNRCIWMDSVYQDRNISNILQVNRKIFTDQRVKDCIKECGPLYAHFDECDRDGTLLSYYDDSTKYESHKDKDIFTCLWWTYRHPKAFTGGDLTLTDLEQTIELKDNRLVIFLSQFRHEVSEVKMIKPQPPYSGLGRFCLTNFVGYEK